MADERDRQRLAEFLWRREGGACVSVLVSTVQQAHGTSSGDLGTLAEQAFELCSPVLDFEEAGRWHINNEMERGDLLNFFDDNEHDGATVDQMRTEMIAKIEEDDTWEELAESEGFDAYEREVYEHWIVSDWLADKLIARGEKCDKDFANLTIWARCTSGQAVYSDGVIEDIAAAVWPTAEDRARVLKD